MRDVLPASRLLRARRKRPRRAAEQRDELAPPQPIEMHPLPLQGRQDSGLGGIKSGALCSAGFWRGV
jgi:hypothetical protein